MNKIVSYFFDLSLFLVFILFVVWFFGYGSRYFTYYTPTHTEDLNDTQVDVSSRSRQGIIGN